MSDNTMVLPWETGLRFHVFGYTAGHSQLVLRGQGAPDSDVLIMLFESVEFMKLRREYPLATFRRTSPAEDVEFGELSRSNLLRVSISSPVGTGLVACGRITVRRATTPTDFGYGGEVLMSMSMYR